MFTLNKKIHPKWKGKKWNEKLQKYTCMPNVLALLSQPERTY